MNVSLAKLQQLVAVARCQNITRAAAELNFSQPALSRSIAFVENAYGVKIFDRTPQGVVPTQSGRSIIEEANRLLLQAETFDHNASLIGGGTLGQVRVGMGPAVACLVMARACAELITGDRRISFLAQIRRSDYLVRSLLAEDVELGLLIEVHLDMPIEVEVLRLGSLSSTFVARKGHPLADRRNVPIDDIRDYPVASVFDLNVRESFRPLNCTIACEDYSAMCDVVRETDALYFCSNAYARIACADGRIVKLDVDIPEVERAFKVMAITLKGRTLSPAAQSIIDCCRKVVEEG